MAVIILTLLCLSPFANFVIQKVDIWHAQGYFVQFGILILYCLHLAKRNKPLGALLFWLGSLTMYYWVDIHIKRGIYPVYLLLPLFNFICIVILYEIFTRYITEKHIWLFAKYFSIVLFIIMGYAVLQYFNLDQFYNHIEDYVKVDSVVGIMGNQMHFAHFLAICCPVFFLLKKKWCVAGIVSTLGIILLTKTSSGLFIALVLFFLCGSLCKTFTKREAIASILLLILVVIYKLPQFGSYFSDSHRFEMWGKFVPFFKESPITGLGLGNLSRLAVERKIVLGSPDTIYRFAHNEYWHFAIEIGIIGLALIFWGVIDYFRKFLLYKNDKTTVCMAGIFFGFLLCSIVGFPAHLWIPSTLAILGYSYINREV